MPLGRVAQGNLMGEVSGGLHALCFPGLRRALFLAVSKHLTYGRKNKVCETRCDFSSLKIFFALKKLLATPPSPTQLTASNSSGCVVEETYM